MRTLCKPSDFGDLNQLLKLVDTSIVSSVRSIMDIALKHHLSLSFELTQYSDLSVEGVRSSKHLCRVQYGDFGFKVYWKENAGRPKSWSEKGRVVDDACFFVGLDELEWGDVLLQLHDVQFKSRSSTHPFRQLPNFLPDFQSWSDPGIELVVDFDSAEVLVSKGLRYLTRFQNGQRYIALRCWRHNPKDYWVPISAERLVKVGYELYPKSSFEWLSSVYNGKDPILFDTLSNSLKPIDIPNYTQVLTATEMREQLLQVLWYIETTQRLWPRFPYQQLYRFVHSLDLIDVWWSVPRRWERRPHYPHWMQTMPMTTTSLMHFFCDRDPSLSKFISTF